MSKPPTFDESVSRGTAEDTQTLDAASLREGLAVSNGAAVATAESPKSPLKSLTDWLRKVLGGT